MTDTAEGEVTQDLFWITTLDEKFTDEQKTPVTAVDRGLIQVYYTPATRDPKPRSKHRPARSTARLFRAIEWSKGTKKTIEDARGKLSERFAGEPAIEAISDTFSERWKELHDGTTDKDPSLAWSANDSKKSSRKCKFCSNKVRRNRARPRCVSDGQQSLFYFALVAAVFDLERDAVAGKIKGFHGDSSASLP